MADRIREEYVAKLNAARQELKTAEIFHRRDLTKHIRRMERELRDYDRFHKGGDSNGKRAKPTSLHQ
jgi:hypothetical protein